jgi:hypothetical protein
MFCSACGANAGDAGFCPRCGSAMSSGVPGASAWQAPPPPEPPRRSLLPTALAGAGVGLVIVLLATIAFILHSQVGGSDPVAAAAATHALSPTSRAPAATVTTTVSSRPHKHHRTPVRSTAPTTPSYAGPGDVRGLAAGLFCRDLYARGYSYSAAVDYWRLHGQPNQMDIDRNGVPCETVYPPSDVSDYWGFTSLPDTSALPAGLFCRDLHARGYSYTDAVSYWYLHGEPDQMDIDLNGIPCETVYPRSDVDNYWY